MSHPGLVRQFRSKFTRLTPGVESFDPGAHSEERRGRKGAKTQRCKARRRSDQPHLGSPPTTLCAFAPLRPLLSLAPASVAGGERGAVGRDDGGAGEERLEEAPVLVL